MYPLFRSSFACALSALWVGLSAFTAPAGLAAAPGGGERRATVPVVYITPAAREGEPATSGFMLVDVRITDNPRRIPVVSCSMSKPGATNDSWEASAWIAAFAAARETRHQMLEYEYYVNAPEPIDGPSAGMLLSATMLSLIKGDAVLPGRAMTGSVNPDGTIGPVSGIIAKIAAAQKAHVSRFGFPVGQRLEYSEEEKDYIDVCVRARQYGMEAVELRDLNDAYFLLTGQKTGMEADNVPTAPPVLSQVTADHIRAGYLGAHEQLQQELTRTRALYASTKPRPELRDEDLRGGLDRAQRFDSEGNLSYEAGALTIAYLRELSAAFACESAAYELETIAAANAKHTDRDKVKASVDALQGVRDRVAGERASLLDTIQANLTAPSLVLRMESLNAYINLREGFAQELAGDQLVATSIQQANSVTRRGGIPAGFQECVARACSYYAFAHTRFMTSQEFYSAPAPRAHNEDVALRLTPEFEQSIGNAFSQGSQAALVFLDTTMRGKWRAQVKQRLTSERIAEGFEANFEDRIESVSLVDPSYLPNELAAKYDQRQSESERSAIASVEGDHWKFSPVSDGNLDSFGSGATAYLGLSSMVLEYYNYLGRPKRMAHSRSYGIYLDLARSKALDGARRLEEQMKKEIGGKSADPKEAGASLLPTALVLNLDLADSLRYGDENDRVTCLKVYWRVSLLCDLALDMIRQSKS